MALSGGRWTRGLTLAVALGTVLLCLVVVSNGSPSPSHSHSHSSSHSRNVRTKRNILQNLAVERILRDKGFVRSLINCVLDKGPCDGHGRHLKRLAPDIIRGHCPGCDRASKNHIRRVISHVQRNFPEEWTEVMHRFLRYPSQQLHNVFNG